ERYASTTRRETRACTETIYFLLRDRRALSSAFRPRRRCASGLNHLQHTRYTKKESPPAGEGEELVTKGLFRRRRFLLFPLAHRHAPLSSALFAHAFLQSGYRPDRRIAPPATILPAMSRPDAMRRAASKNRFPAIPGTGAILSFHPR